MFCTKLAPKFHVEIDDINLWIIFTDADNGFKSVYNIDKVAKQAEDGFWVQPHCGHTVSHGTGLLPLTFALSFENSLARLTGPPSALQGSDWNQSKSSHTTGDADRFFISVGGERCQRGFLDGLASLKSRASDQENRPVAWWPFTFKYNGYFGILDNGVDKWKYDSMMLNGIEDPADGWDIFDAAHLESACLFYGAAIGDRQCLANFFMLAAWVYSTFPGGGPKAIDVQKGWHGSNQERARGLRYWFDARAIMLGFDTAEAAVIDIFFAGQAPKRHTIAIINDAVDNPQPLGGDHADDRTMVDFKDGSGEIKAFYGWGNGMMFGGWGYLRRTGIINDPLRSKMDVWMFDRAADVIKRTISRIGTSYAASSTKTFTQADVDKANALETDKGHDYELVDFGGGVGVIRDKPRKADSEVMAGGLALLYGYSHPVVQILLNVCDKIGSVDYDKRAKYLDVAYGQIF
jgi:hypothetical protein